MLDQPNILLICTDHWPASLLGEAGHSVIQTPTLDQLARNGIRFTNAYSTCPVCIPARHSLMTGASPRGHNMRYYNDTEPMPNLPTLAQTFRNVGYQAYAVGKLHVYPQRDRIGFDDVILAEEGRVQFGVVDDYEMFLTDQGYAGQHFAHGMNNNEYLARPWHLPEDCHVTNWTTRRMARVIQRRDPTRPAFWYLSYTHPHPPLTPLSSYLDLYRDFEPEPPYLGEWASDAKTLPYPLKSLQHRRYVDQHVARLARQAFYALCTHIDHQLRVVIGTLREEGLLDNTVILFTSDHGDMLGNHGLWAKKLFYEDSANVPMILMGVAGDERVGHYHIEKRLVCLEDVMPTLLGLAGIDIPDTVEGLSMVGLKERDNLYGEHGENDTVSRMIHDGRFKLIYYPVGNYFQLFDLHQDPQEMHNLANLSTYAETVERLSQCLFGELYGGDERWFEGGKFVGLPDKIYTSKPERNFFGQRGLHFPGPPGTTQ